MLLSFNSNIPAHLSLCPHVALLLHSISKHINLNPSVSSAQVKVLLYVWVGFMLICLSPVPVLKMPQR